MYGKISDLWKARLDSGKDPFQHIVSIDWVPKNMQFDGMGLLQMLMAGGI